jgi:hypothetical protein
MRFSRSSPWVGLLAIVACDEDAGREAAREDGQVQREPDGGSPSLDATSAVESDSWVPIGDLPSEAGAARNDGGERSTDGGVLCDGFQGLPCPDGQFCSHEGPLELGCGSADELGACSPTPQGCTLDYAPVCGCDGKTHPNRCAAHAAGTSVMKLGECNPPQDVSCDPRKALCKRLPPECPGDQVPSVVDSCYGECVPIAHCVCTEAAACPEEERFVCHMSAGHCGPYVN